MKTINEYIAEYYTIKEVQKLLNISKSTLYKTISNNPILSENKIKFLGNSYIKKSAIEEFLESSFK